MPGVNWATSLLADRLGKAAGLATMDFVLGLDAYDSKSLGEFDDLMRRVMEVYGRAGPLLYVGDHERLHDEVWRALQGSRLTDHQKHGLIAHVSKAVARTLKLVSSEMSKSLRSERAVVKFEKAAALLARIPARTLNVGMLGMDIAEVALVFSDPKASQLEKTLAAIAMACSQAAATSEPKQRLIWSLLSSLAGIYPIVNREDPSHDVRVLLETAATERRPLSF